ncbi:hypothetical protein PIIN_06698 [Serendipita indica DSM 11827]|uniref:Uncharacterized protein n=1 Tax=Serendipita indica (strain DSM 11827) TaxID=1109443 RepID=G4TN62_SERID|nr:hypothetical protein PIIN_06698 [Serendipita indica DSM 11827]
MEHHTLPADYPYRWTPTSEFTLDEFLEKYKPSSIRNDVKNSKPFICVAAKSNENTEVKYTEAVKEATALVNEVAKQVEDIKNNNDIPVRANKKKGTKSKKEVREELQAKATVSLKKIATENGFVNGKWIAFVDQTQATNVFNKVAHSLVSGPLSQTKAWQVRVRTLPVDDPQDDKPRQSNIEVLLPDIYDEEAAREVMKVLLRHHGLRLAGAKPNLYTAIELDSKHLSGIPSTVWKGSGGPGSVLSEAEVQALRNEYFAELEEAKKEANGGEGEGSAPKKTSGPIKAMNKETDENPFGSDEDEDEESRKPKNAQPKKAAPAPKRPRKQAQSDEDEDDTPRKKQAKPTAAASKRGGAARPRPRVAAVKAKMELSDDSE